VTYSTGLAGDYPQDHGKPPILLDSVFTDRSARCLLRGNQDVHLAASQSQPTGLLFTLARLISTASTAREWEPQVSGNSTQRAQHRQGRRLFCRQTSKAAKLLPAAEDFPEAESGQKLHRKW
jgi:hypothetical protein